MIRKYRMKIENEAGELLGSVEFEHDAEHDGRQLELSPVGIESWNPNSVVELELPPEPPPAPTPTQLETRRVIDSINKALRADRGRQ